MAAQQPSMSASSKKRGISVLGPEHSPSNGKRAKTAAANTPSDTTSTTKSMIANTKTTRPKTLPQSPGTMSETPTPHSSSSASPSSSSVSASSSDNASTGSALDPNVPSSPSPSPSPRSPSSSSGSSSSSPSSRGSPRLPQNQSRHPPGTQLSIRPPPPKPPLTPLTSFTPLRARLSSFLPALAAANEELELERAAGRLAERDIENLGAADDELGEGGRVYIEMELGLGVLEERREGVEGESEGEVGGGGGEMGGEEDVLGELLGREGRRRKERPGIEVVDAG